jgi:hypothetical protein
MTYAGIPPTVAENKTIQQRVRRLASKLDIKHLVLGLDLDKGLQGLNPSDCPLFSTRPELD